MEAKGWQDFLKKWPTAFAFISFTLGFFGLSIFLRANAIVDLFPYYHAYAWWLVPGLVGVVVVDRAFPKKRETRDTDACLDSCAYVVTTSKRLIDELYGRDDSVVKGARKFLYVTGSRSRDMPYLDAIESQVHLRPDMAHVRLLVGEPHHEILANHIARLKELASTRQPSRGDAEITVCEYPLGGSLTERFIAVSDEKAIITLPSINNAYGYDTALILEDQGTAQQIGSIISTLSQGCDKIYVGKQRRKPVGEANEAV